MLYSKNPKTKPDNLNGFRCELEMWLEIRAPRMEDVRSDLELGPVRSSGIALRVSRTGYEIRADRTKTSDTNAIGAAEALITSSQGLVY